MNSGFTTTEDDRQATSADVSRRNVTRPHRYLRVAEAPFETSTSAPARFESQEPPITRVAGEGWQQPNAGARLSSDELRQALAHRVLGSFSHISVDHAVKSGAPVIAGTKITVAQIYDLAADGLTASQIADQFYGEISEEDVREAFRFAAELIR